MLSVELICSDISLNVFLWLCAVQIEQLTRDGRFLKALADASIITAHLVSDDGESFQVDCMAWWVVTVDEAEKGPNASVLRHQRERNKANFASRIIFTRNYTYKWPCLWLRWPQLRHISRDLIENCFRLNGRFLHFSLLFFSYNRRPHASTRPDNLVWLKFAHGEPVFAWKWNWFFAARLGRMQKKPGGALEARKKF